MKVALFDVDSKIPNLALMKISSYHKQIGDSVSMYQPLFFSRYDKIYASKIFDFSSSDYLYPSMEVGGTGVSLKDNLPDEIEKQTPDYSLYEYKDNLGFTQRGCRLKCSFCVVPKKEGGPKPENTIDEIWTQRESRHIVLLDNDFFGNPQWQERIDELIEYDLSVNFCQGLNIRNLKEEQAIALASVKFKNYAGNKKGVYFAWDDPRHERLIHKGIKLCLDVGIKAYQMSFYVLIGYHSTIEEDLHRVEVLRGYGCNPFAMPYNKNDLLQKRFARWVNHKAIFKSVAWKDYGKIPKPTNEQQSILWNTHSA